MAKKKISFEEALDELEQIINFLENKEPSLAELTEYYKRGTELSAFCLNAINEAEKALDVYIDFENGEVVEKTLEL